MASNLNDRFKEFGSTPTNDLWNRIEASMDEKKKRRPLFVWIYYSFAAVFVVCLLLVSLWPVSTKISERTLSTKEPEIQKMVKQADKKTHFVKKIEKKNQLLEKINPSNIHHSAIHELKKYQTEKGKKEFQMSNGFKTKEEIDYVSNKIEKQIPEGRNNSKQSPLNTDKTVVLLKEPIEMNDLGDISLQKEADTSNNIDIASNDLDSNKNEIRDELSKSITKRGFEFGLSYSCFTSQSKIRDASENYDFNDNSATTSTYLSNGLNNNSDTIAKFYRISIPNSYHLNVNFYFNNKWRLDSEFGYSNFRYTYMDKDKIALSHYSIIHAISLPMSLTHLWYFKETGHSISYSSGVIHDFSFENWNLGNGIYYSLSGQMKVGYGYFFGSSQKWKAYINLAMRYNFLESKAIKSQFNKRLLYGSQIGITKLF